jgi:hypothetical protein
MSFLTDFTIDFETGNIRHASGSTIYSIYDMHAALQDKADNVEGRTKDNPSKLAGERNVSQPMSMTLLNNGPDEVEYNITVDELEFLKFGSVSQEGGDVLFSGIKTIGSIVAASPIYLVQDGVKLTTFWSTGHIQVLVNVKNAGTLIDSGKVTAFSRKYGQYYDNFEVDLSNGSETSAAINTSLDSDNDIAIGTVPSYNDITLTFGDSNHDLLNGNGSKAYKGAIDIKGHTLKEAYNYFKYITRDGSDFDMDGTDGELYLKLNAAYPVISKSPIGTFAGGKLFMAQGWFLTGVKTEEATLYELIAHDGTRQVPPILASVSITNTMNGDAVVVAKTTERGGPVTYAQYTLAAGNDSGDGTVVIKENIAVDTPSAGYIRVDSDWYQYSSWTGKTFTLALTLSKSYAENAQTYVPLIDAVATTTSISNTFLYNADFWIVIMVRNNGAEIPIKPFITWQLVGSAGASVATIRTPA